MRKIFLDSLARLLDRGNLVILLDCFFMLFIQLLDYSLKLESNLTVFDTGINSLFLLRLRLILKLPSLA
jgi:hypothetical protein